MVWKILAATAALIVASRFVARQISETRQRSRYPAVTVLGGILLALMFVGLVIMMFVSDDASRMQYAATATFAFASAGSGLLIFAHLQRRN